MTWDLDYSSGLLDDYDFVVEEAWFGTDPGYFGGKQTLLTLKGPASQDDVVVDEDHTIWLSLGKGWKAIRGGESVEHEGGRDAFRADSAVGIFIKHIVSDEHLGLYDVMKERGNPAESQTWVGLAFHIERQKVGQIRDRETKEIRDREQPVPVSLEIVEDDGGQKKSKSRARGGRSGGRGESRSGRRARTKTLTAEELEEKVIDFASGFDDDNFFDFVDDVLDPEFFEHAEAVKDNEDLYARVMEEDGDLWNASRK